MNTTTYEHAALTLSLASSERNTDQLADMITAASQPKLRLGQHDPNDIPLSATAAQPGLQPPTPSKRVYAT